MIDHGKSLVRACAIVGAILCDVASASAQGTGGASGAAASIMSSMPSASTPAPPLGGARAGQPPANSAMRQAQASGGGMTVGGTGSSGTATATNALTLTSRGSADGDMRMDASTMSGRAAARQSDSTRIAATGVIQRGSPQR